MNVIVRRIRSKLERIIDNLHYGRKGHRSRIVKPVFIAGKKRIYIGDNVNIFYGARIETIKRWAGVECNGILKIGNGTSIQQFCHIIASNEVSIGNDCVLSAFVYISDCSHQYTPPKV